MNSYISSIKFLVNLTNNEAKCHHVKMTIVDLKQFFRYIEELEQTVEDLRDKLDSVETLLSLYEND